MSALVVSLLLTAGPLPEGIQRQTLTFYNARVAQREKRHADVLTLWLLRNSLTDMGYQPQHDGAFHSLVWAASGAMGICQDGLHRDEDAGGAGLWPVALHNFLLTTKEPDDLPSPFEAYDVGRQQRHVSYSDVLDSEELDSVTYSPTFCIGPRLALVEYELNPLGDLQDRLVLGPLLRKLLRRSLKTVRRDKVTTVAALEARIFDLDLALTELRKQRTREVASEAAADVRATNMSAAAARSTLKQVTAALQEPAQVAFLQRTLQWKPAEWLTLSRGRREFLFFNARAHAADPEALRTLTLGLIDALAARDAGRELGGYLSGMQSEADRAQVTEGARGERLLALADTSGFGERSVIALHRGVRALERGDLANALQGFAFALAHSDTSKDASTVHALARRWLSYVLSRYEASPEVLATLKTLVPRADLNPIVADLIWAAALRSDTNSFDRIERIVQRGGSFDGIVNRLALMAHRKPAEFIVMLRTSAEEAPWETARFLRQLIDALEREEADVRRANRELLGQVLGVLDSIANAPQAAKSNERAARELAGRTLALLQSMGASPTDATSKNRTLDLAHSTFAGSLRLAPADALPWPFVAPEPDPPPAFSPFLLVPVEWRAADGSLVFGWRITE